MAKKGGVSEINGFVSVKNENSKPVSKKVVTKTPSENQRRSTSTSKTSSRTNGTTAQNSKDVSDSKPKRSPSSETKLKNEIAERQVKTQNVTSKTSPRDQKISSPKVTITNNKTTEKPVLKSKTEVIVKSLTSPKQKVSVSSKSEPVKKLVTKNAVASVQKSTKVPSTRSSRPDTIKQSSDRTATKTDSIKITKKPSSQSTVSSTKTKSKSTASSSKSTSIKKTSSSKDTTSVQVTTKDKTNILIKDTSDSTLQDVDEINIKTSHKDSVYFEVDLGEKDKRRGKSSKRREQETPVTQLERPITRQGTFTKEDQGGGGTASPEAGGGAQGTEEQEEEYEYEDDFEDYESDFEEYISESGVSSDSEQNAGSESPAANSPLREEPKTPGDRPAEEERKLDSGSYELRRTSALRRPPSLRQSQLEQIKEAIVRENSLYRDRSIEKHDALDKKENELVIWDFVTALQKQSEAVNKKHQKSRSTVILEKIKLHVQQMTIFDDPFFQVDDSESYYRNRNVSHAFCEAEIITRNEETETDVINQLDKWTQFPSYFQTMNENVDRPLEEYIKNFHGVGGDEVSIDVKKWTNPFYNAEKLYSFIHLAGQEILVMLEEEEMWHSDQSLSVLKSKHNQEFSKGYIPMQTKNLEFLKGRFICDIVFSPHNQNHFISSHRFVKDIESLSSLEDQFLGRSILCLWNILEPSQPLSIFVASCQVSALCFDTIHVNLLYAGLTDGSVCLWDMHERSMYHNDTVAGMTDFLLRTPSYCSSYLIKEDHHSNVIVAIHSVGFQLSEKHTAEKFTPTEVVTLDSDGKMMVWVVVLTLSEMEGDLTIDKEETGQTYWSKFKLVASITLEPVNSLPAAQHSWSLQFLCMCLAPERRRSVLVGTNTGSVVHCILSNQKADVPVYSNNDETDCFTSVISLERSPHQCPVFLAGCSNGSVRMHLMDRKRPIRIFIMESQLRGSPVTKIRWSLFSPGLFFALDKQLSLYVWDLCKNETSPIVTISMKKMKATYFDISKDKQFFYLALAVHKDRLEIHKMKEEMIMASGDDKGNLTNFMSLVDKWCY